MGRFSLRSSLFNRMETAVSLRRLGACLLLGAGLAATACAQEVAALRLNFERSWIAATLGPVAAVLVGGVMVATLVGWWRVHGWARLCGDGATASLLVAGVGLVVLCAAGALHGLALMPGPAAVAGFFAGFLLPLVTGALSQLLPVWCHPGPVTPARTRLRGILTRQGRIRALLFLAAGLLLLAGQVSGAALAALGVALFALPLLRGLLKVPAGGE